MIQPADARITVLKEDIVRDDKSDPMLGAYILQRFPQTKAEIQPNGRYHLRTIYVAEPAEME